MDDIFCSYFVYCFRFVLFIILFLWIMEIVMNERVKVKTDKYKDFNGTAIDSYGGFSVLIKVDKEFRKEVGDFLFVNLTEIKVLDDE